MRDAVFLRTLVLSTALAAAVTGCAREHVVHGREVAATSPRRATDATANAIGDEDDAPSAEDSPGRAGGGSAAADESALAGSTFREVVPKALDAEAPAMRYAKMGAQACRAEVKKRKLPFAPVKSTQKQVSGAMRLTGALNGVKVSTPPATTKWGVLDCRMALLLDDLTKELAARDVVSMAIDNIYRPHAHLPGKKKASQHAFGLALDVTRFVLADGRVIAPETWGAAIGETACGPEATMTEPNSAKVATRDMICEIGRKGFFHTILTPSFDAAHQTHFHLDIKKDGKTCGVR